jgi:oxygen-independent coproporphyrinogen-3 oxidase
MRALLRDLELVKKYNKAGPRYTSYPPATKFTDAVTWDQLREKIEENNRSPRDLSVYVHIPFCETLCWFCGCTTVITPNHDKGRDYVESLGREIAAMAAHLNPSRKVVQLHLGGGSPTFLRPGELRRLGEIVHKHFVLSQDVEAGVEVDPRRLTRDHLVALREVGFNRASMGVQDLDPAVQAAVHRIQPPEMTLQTMEWMRELGYGSINIDLIYGLPHQTPESFGRTVDAILEMEPDRLAVFSYAHVPWIKPAQKILEDKVLPTPEVKLQLLKLVIEKLTADDRYVYIGMDHFAKPTDELAVAQRDKRLQRNFQGYSTRADCDLIGFGASSIGKVGDVYAQNARDLAGYGAAIDSGRLAITRGVRLTRDDRLRRDIITRLMCQFELRFDALEAAHGIDFRTGFADEIRRLAPLEDDGLVSIERDAIRVRPAGRMLVRNVAMIFDRYLAHAGRERFSRTI